MFLIQKATLFGITALTSIAMTGSFNVNSAQAAISNRSYLNLNLDSNSLNSKVETGNSLTKLPAEEVEVATFIRRVKIKKKDSVRYRVGNETNNNNKPAEVNNSVRERTNNNKPASVNNNSTQQELEPTTEKKTSSISPKQGVEVATFIRRIKIRKKDSVRYRVGNETNNNQPASVNNSVRERTNNNKPASVNNNSTDKK